MNNLIKSFIFYIILVVSSQARAIDDVQFLLQKQFPPEVRWDNIVGVKPHWLSGPKSINGHFVSMESGEELLIHLDRDAMLRLHSSDYAIDPGMFDVKISRGSGLYHSKIFSVTNNTNDLILNNDNDYPVVVRLSAKESGAKKPITFFVSRYEPIPVLAFYPDAHNLKSSSYNLPKTNVGRAKSVNQVSYSKLDNIVVSQFMVVGPARLELLARYMYDINDAQESFPYRVNISLDGNAIADAVFIAQPDYYNLYLNNAILSRPDTYYFTVPEGKHNLKLSSIAPIFVQVHSLENKGYLLPNRNGKPIAMEVGAATQNQSILENALLLAQDNTWKASGLKSKEIIDNLRMQRKDDLSLRTLQDEVTHSFTFFKDLIPLATKSKQNLSLDWVPDYTLIDSENERKRYNFSDTQNDNILKQLVQGYFIELKNGKNNKLTYAIPEVGADSELKIAVQQSELNQPHNLYIQYGDNKPQLLTIYPKRDLEINQYSPNHGIIGLSILERNLHNNEPKMATLSGAFAQNNMPGNLRSAGVIILPLPKGTDHVHIWQNSSEIPLKVAVQCRHSKKFYATPVIVQKQVEKYEEKGQKASILFIQALRFFDHCHKTHCSLSADSFIKHLEEKKMDISSRESIAGLYNHWLDTIRLLYERYQRLASGMSGADPVYIASKKGKDKTTPTNASEAENLTSDQQWPEATIEWSKVLKEGSVDDWQNAHLKRAEALHKSGESYLAERSLKALIISAKDVDTKYKAYEKLRELYEKRKFNFGLEGLLMAYFIHIGESDEQLRLLSSILVEDGYQEKAVDLAILVSDQKPAQSTIFSAAKTITGRNGIRPGEKLETQQEKNFWQAQELQQAGFYPDAIKMFNNGGEEGKIWASHLKEGLNIKHELQDKSEEKRQVAIGKWMDWYHNHPGPKTWERAHYLVKSFYEIASVYSATRDISDISFIATPNSPVILKVSGIAKLQIRLRPVMKTAKDLLKKENWVIIKKDDIPYYVKIDNFLGEGVLKVSGYEKYFTGIEQQHELEIGSGEHEIQIESKNEVVLVQPFIERPVMALTVLPPVISDTIDFLSNHIWKKKAKVSDSNSMIYNLVETKPYNGTYQKHLKTQVARIDELPIDYKETNPIVTKATTVDGTNSTLEEKLSKILFDYTKSNSQELLVKGSKICYDDIGTYDIDQTCNSFSLLSRWNRVLSVDNDAQIVIIEDKDKWDPDSEALEIRKNLMSVDYKNYYILADTSIAVMQFTNAEATNVKMEAALLALIIKNAGNATVGYQIDNEPIQQVYIDNANKVINTEFSIAKGKHSLRLFLVDPNQETFVGLKLLEKKSGEDSWKAIEMKRKKEYFVATKKMPLEYTIKAPSWVQIHSISEKGHEDIQDYFVESGQKKIVLKPNGQDKRTLYRIFVRFSAHPMVVANMQAQSPIDFEELKDSPVEVLSIAPAKMFSLQDDLPLFGQNCGTWSLSNSAVQNIASDSVNNVAAGSGIDQSEKGLVKYMEQNATYRYFNPYNQTYFRTDLLLREFTKASPSYGIKARLDYIPTLSPFSIFVGAQGFSQRFNGASNYSLLGQVGIKNTIIWTRKIDQEVEVSFFGRHIKYKMDTVSNNKFPDPDVYTNYNKIHKRGIDFLYIVNFKPVLDTKFFAGIGARSSHKMSRVDYTDYKIGVEQLIAPFVIGFDYSHKRYFKVDGRLFNFNRNKVGGYISWDHWLKKNNQRLEVNFALARVIDSNISNRPLAKIQPKPVKAWIGSLGVTWHLGNGRNYRDFRPGEVKFRQLKQKSIPVKNEMR